MEFCVEDLFTRRTSVSAVNANPQQQSRRLMVKEEKKDKLIAHRAKTGAGGASPRWRTLAVTEDLGGAQEVGAKASQTCRRCRRWSSTSWLPASLTELCIKTARAVVGLSPRPSRPGLTGMGTVDATKSTASFSWEVTEVKSAVK